MLDSRFYAAEKEANKDEMVLRWNSYKRLIDSNRELKKHLEEVVSEIKVNGIDGQYLDEIIERAETAINNAKNLQP